MNNPFQVSSQGPAVKGQDITNNFSEISDPIERVKTAISSSPVVIFMKGNALFPQCGFSANSVAILNQVAPTFSTFNILEDQEVRQGIKEFSGWPTFPQIYVNGELIGGNDILTEMYQNGELKKILSNN